MENKKTLFAIFILILSVHFYLFNQLKLNKEEVFAAKPSSSKVQINLKNITIKNKEIEISKKTVEDKVNKKLIQTNSKNTIKKVEKAEKKETLKKETLKKEKTAKDNEEILKENVLEQITKKIVKTKVVEKLIPVETLKAIENKYFQKIQELIEKNKKYPKIAKRLNQSGEIYLNFTIYKNGQIANIKITKSSNFRRLNKAAIEIMSEIEKFDPIPDELNKDIWNITVPIVYKINRS